MEYLVIYICMATLIALLYFLPTLIASSRQHHNKGGIFALNLLLGWTFIGWAIAFIWSVTATRKPQPAPQPAQASGITVTLTDEQAARLGLGPQASSREHHPTS